MSKLENFFFSASFPRVYYYENFKQVKLEKKHDRFLNEKSPYPILLVRNKNNYICMKITNKKHQSGKAFADLISEAIKMLEEKLWASRIKKFVYLMIFTPLHWLKYVKIKI